MPPQRSGVLRSGRTERGAQQTSHWCEATRDALPGERAELAKVPSTSNTKQTKREREREGGGREGREGRDRDRETIKMLARRTE